MQTTETSVRKAITVSRAPDDAFRIFTEGIADWWPLGTHSVGQERAETIVLEGWVGGRLYERIAGGEESDWGEILLWEPPRRFVSTWHAGRGPETAQELEVSFTPAGGGTRVDLEHRGWERLGDKADSSRARYDSGWDGVLSKFAETVDASSRL